MLNITKLKNKIIKPNVKTSKGNPTGITRYYPPAIQEWKDSIYAFNKNTTKIIPVANNFIHGILNSYFNMFNIKSERKIKSAHIRKWKRRLIGNKIWISKPELKHCNDNIIINLYVYNRQYSVFLKKLKKLKPTWGHKRKMTLKKFYYTKKILSEKRKIYYKDWLKRSINKFMKKKLKFKEIFFSNTFDKFLKNLDTHLLKHIFSESFYCLIKKIFKYQIIHLRYKYIIMLNKLKFSDTYLIYIKQFLQKIYNKKIEFNIVSLKNFNFDSNILAQIVTSKLRNRKNKPLKVIKTSIRKSKIQTFNKHFLKVLNREILDKQNYIISNMYKQNKNDHLNNILKNELYIPINNTVDEIRLSVLKKDKKDLAYRNMVLNSTKNKYIIGIRMQASGRITRRLIAQRASCKVRYKGSLKDINSSYKGLSSVIIKGYEKSCLQYTYLSNRRKIGAFGVKGWVNTV